MSKTFGQVLKQLRTKTAYTQRDLADLMEVHHTYISKLENDAAGVSPSRELVTALAGLFEVEPDYLIALADKYTRDELKAENERLQNAKAEFEEMVRGVYDQIWNAVGDGKGEWDYPAQIVRYAEYLRDERDNLKRELATLKQTT